MMENVPAKSNRPACARNVLPTVFFFDKIRAEDVVVTADQEF